MWDCYPIKELWWHIRMRRTFYFMRNPKLIIHTLLYKEIKLTLSLKDGSKGMPSGWDKKDYLQCHHSERNHNIKCPPSLQTLACTESIRKYNLRASITWEKKKIYSRRVLTCYFPLMQYYRSHILRLWIYNIWKYSG